MHIQDLPIDCLKEISKLSSIKDLINFSSCCLYFRKLFNVDYIKKLHECKKTQLVRSFELKELFQGYNNVKEAIHNDIKLLGILQFLSHEELLQLGVENANIVDIQIEYIYEYHQGIEWIPNPHALVQLKSVEMDPSSIQYIDKPSLEIQLIAVKRNGYTIQHIDHPHPEVQIAAVEQNGWCIKYIETPSEDVQLAAIRQNEYSIQYILHPSKKVQLEAVKQDPECIKHIKHPHLDTQLEVVNKCAYNIQHISDPHPETQLMAAKLKIHSIFYVRVPCDELLMYLYKHFISTQCENTSFHRKYLTLHSHRLSSIF